MNGRKKSQKAINNLVITKSKLYFISINIVSNNDIYTQLHNGALLIFVYMPI